MSDKPYPFTEEQEAWLRDLETTEEPQTYDYLHNAHGFCCLGRACVVLGMKGKKHKNGVRQYDDATQVLPESIRARLHLRDNIGDFDTGVEIYREGHDESIVADALAELNDNGWSFKRIAAYIRANPWNVFEDPDEKED